MTSVRTISLFLLFLRFLSIDECWFLAHMIEGCILELDAHATDSRKVDPLASC